MSEQKNQSNINHEPQFSDPVLHSRTATDYLPHKLDTFEYVGNYQPKYLLVLWAIYCVWATWYGCVHYLPDMKKWFSPAYLEMAFGGYSQDYWDDHVEEATMGGYFEKINIDARLKALEGKVPAKAPGVKGDEPPAGDAAPAAAGGADGMGFSGAEELEGIKAETVPASPEDMKE